MISSLKGPVAEAAQLRRQRHQKLCPADMWVSSRIRQRKLTPWFQRRVTAGAVNPESAMKATKVVKRKRDGDRQQPITKFFTNNGRKKKAQATKKPPALKKAQVIKMTDNDIEACKAVERALTSLGIRVNGLARKDGTIRQFCHFTIKELPKITVLDVTKVNLKQFPARIMHLLTGLQSINVYIDQLWDIPRQWAALETDLIATPGKEDALANLFKDVVLSQ